MIGTPMVAFAASELGRRPGQTALTAVTLAAVVVVVGAPLLLHQGLASASEAALARAPSLVVRRVEGGGFAPVSDLDAAVAAARSVRGVVEARARRWGVVAGPSGAVTVVGVDGPAARRLAEAGLEAPGGGAAVVGRAVGAAPGAPLRLAGADGPVTLRVEARVQEASDLVSHDLALVGWSEAGRLLGLDEGGASDLALWVHAPAEAEAIRGELSRAMPWPVRITTRDEARRAQLASAGRRAGGVAAAAVPTVLALALLMVVAGGGLGREGRREVALLKLLGWTTAEVARLRLYQAVAVGVPAVAAGAAVAWAAVVWPGAPAVVGAALGWSGVPPELGLGGHEALGALAAVAGIVLAPWAAASIAPALRLASTDPAELLDG